MKTRKVSAKIRVSQLAPAAKVVEASSPNGEGLLIQLSSPDEGTPLYVYPYNAGRNVYLVVGDHKDDCRLYTNRSATRRCDCGACLVWRNGRWTPTSKAQANSDALGALVGPPSA